MLRCRLHSRFGAVVSTYASTTRRFPITLSYHASDDMLRCRPLYIVVFSLRSYSVYIYIYVYIQLMHGNIYDLRCGASGDTLSFARCRLHVVYAGITHHVCRSACDAISFSCYAVGDSRTCICSKKEIPIQIISIYEKFLKDFSLSVVRYKRERLYIRCRYKINIFVCWNRCPIGSVGWIV